MNRKFQPTPSVSSAARKCIRSTPDSAISTHTPFSARPTTITGNAPKRWIRLPVKKLGAYMPTTCHPSTSAAEANGCEHCAIAIGVAAISRFITP